MATKQATPQITNQTSQNKMYEPAKPMIADLLAKAQQAFALTNNKPYTGQYIAGPNDVQTGAANDLLALAPGLNAGAADVRNLALDTINGKYLMPEGNPALAGAIDAAWAPINRDLTTNVLPGLDDRAIASGAYGNARMALQQEDAIAEAAKRGNEATGKLVFDNYARERQLQMNASSLLPQANQLDLLPSQVQSAVGTQMQGWDQLALDEAFQHYTDSQNAPWFGLDKYASIVNPIASGFGKTVQTGTTTPSQPSFNPISGGIQGGMGGMASMGMMASMIPGLQGFALPMMLAGLAGGGFAGARA